MPSLYVHGNGLLVSKFTVMLENQAAQTDDWFPMFRKQRNYLESLRASYPVKRCHIPEETETSNTSLKIPKISERCVNPLNPELNPICYLLALLAHHFLHVSRIMVNSLTFRLLMSYIYIYIYIYMERIFLMFLDHTQQGSTVGRTPLDE